MDRLRSAPVSSGSVKSGAVAPTCIVVAYGFACHGHITESCCRHPPAGYWITFDQVVLDVEPFRTAMVLVRGSGPDTDDPAVGVAVPTPAARPHRFLQPLLDLRVPVLFGRRVDVGARVVVEQIPHCLTDVSG